MKLLDDLFKKLRQAPTQFDTEQSSAWVELQDRLIRQGLLTEEPPNKQRDMTDAAFIRAGHKPEDRSCDHAEWKKIKKHPPRHCPTCGTCMWDAGD